MNKLLLLVVLCISNTVFGQPADLRLSAGSVQITGTSTNNSQFTGSGSSRQVLYTITNMSPGVPANNIRIWIQKARPDMTISLDPSTSTGWTLVSTPTGTGYQVYQFSGDVSCLGVGCTAQTSVRVIYSLGINLGSGNFPLSFSIINPSGDTFEYNNAVVHQVSTTL